MVTGTVPVLVIVNLTATTPLLTTTTTNITPSNNYTSVPV